MVLVDGDRRRALSWPEIRQLNAYRRASGELSASRIADTFALRCGFRKPQFACSAPVTMTVAISLYPFPCAGADTPVPQANVCVTTSRVSEVRSCGLGAPPLRRTLRICRKCCPACLRSPNSRNFAGTLQLAYICCTSRWSNVPKRYCRPKPLKGRHAFLSQLPREPLTSTDTSISLFLQIIWIASTGCITAKPLPPASGHRTSVPATPSLGAPTGQDSGGGSSSRCSLCSGGCRWARGRGGRVCFRGAFPAAAGGRSRSSCGQGGAVLPGGRMGVSEGGDGTMKASMVSSC